MQRKFTVVYELTIDPLKDASSGMTELDAAEEFAQEIANEANQFHLYENQGESMVVKSVKLVD